MQKNAHSQKLAELVIPAITLVITFMAALAVYYQTQKYFTAERTSYYIERFNSTELVEAREVVDNWLSTGESPRDLYTRIKDRATESGKNGLFVYRNIRTFVNFFQELGVAMKHETLNEEYLWDVFGGLVLRYGNLLKPYIEETRIQLNRPKVLQEFTKLVELMESLDKKYSTK